MQVKIKKLTEQAVLPKQGSKHAAGFDMIAISKKEVNHPNAPEQPCYMEYGTGISLEIPEGFAGFILPRSSVSNAGQSLCNSVGLIDSDYRGEVKFRFYYSSVAKDREYEVGDKIGQLVIMPIPDIQFTEGELETSERGIQGFGSSGK